MQSGDIRGVAIEGAGLMGRALPMATLFVCTVAVSSGSSRRPETSRLISPR
jgi:hypothetical protein